MKRRRRHPILDPALQSARDHADALGTALEDAGFPTWILDSAEFLYVPCLVVSSGRHRLVNVTQYIYIAPNDDDNGELWFWWGSMDPFADVPLAPATEVSTALERVARAVAGITMAGSRAV